MPLAVCSLDQVSQLMCAAVHSRCCNFFFTPGLVMECVHAEGLIFRYAFVPLDLQRNLCTQKAERDASSSNQFPVWCFAWWSMQHKYLSSFALCFNVENGNIAMYYIYIYGLFLYVCKLKLQYLNQANLQSIVGGARYKMIHYTTHI